MPDVKAETQIRRIVADLITDAGRLRETLPAMREAADREYIAREIDMLQAATHRIVAFLDSVEDESRQ